MALESEVIVSKLKAEGISESLAEGINFETEEALNKWVGNAKTFTEKPKAIGDYTEEELKALADKGEVKSLQSLLDKTRASSKKKNDPVPPKPDEPGEIDPAMKAILDRLDKFEQGMTEDKAAREAAKREAMITKKLEGIDSYEASMLKATIPADADDAAIDKAINDFKAHMVAKGLKGYGTKDSKGVDPNNPFTPEEKAAMEKRKKESEERKNKKIG